jgi:hypothetical protein
MPYVLRYVSAFRRCGRRLEFHYGISAPAEHLPRDKNVCKLVPG